VLGAVSHGRPESRGTSRGYGSQPERVGEDYLAVRYVKIIWKIVEVAFNLMKVMGGNWSAVVALVLSMFELHAVWRDELDTAQAL
jgi:hypothetical protein